MPLTNKQLLAMNNHAGSNGAATTTGEKKSADANRVSALLQDPEIVKAFESNKRRGKPLVAVTVFGDEQDFFERLPANDPIRAVVTEHKALGLQGEEKNGVLLHLCMTSRIFQKPASAMVRGRSSSGKDNLLQTAARLFPDECIVRVTSMSKLAAYYGKRNRFKNKILLRGERSHCITPDQAEQTAATRQLISEGRIARDVVLNGELIHLVIDGPVAAFETYSGEPVFDEDGNRVLHVYTDDTPEQTRRVMRSTAIRRSGRMAVADEKSICSRSQEFQRPLTDTPVAIPFAEQIAKALPAGILESRRMIHLVLTIIAATVVIRQHLRSKNDAGELVATLDDYALARHVLMDPLRRALGVNEADEQYQQLRYTIPTGEFTTTSARLCDGLRHPETCQRLLNRLRGIGMIEQVAPSSGPHPARWRWVADSFDELLLPSTSRLASLVSQASQNGP